MNRKRTLIGIGILVLLAVAAVSPILAQRNNPGGSIEAVLQGFEPGTLSSEEEAGILLMREEEKLARDVYLTLYEKWNIPVFANIAESEETHMDSMELLIERYGQEYTPEYISISDYRSIIGSRNEAGVIRDPHFSF